MTMTMNRWAREVPSGATLMDTDIVSLSDHALHRYLERVVGEDLVSDEALALLERDLAESQISIEPPFWVTRRDADAWLIVSARIAFPCVVVGSNRLVALTCLVLEETTKLRPSSRPRDRHEGRPELDIDAIWDALRYDDIGRGACRQLIQKNLPTTTNRREAHS